MSDSKRKISEESKTPSQLKSALKKGSKELSQKERPRHTIYTVTDAPVDQKKKIGINQKIRGFKKLKYQDQISVNQVFRDLYELTGSRMSNVYSITIPNRFSFDPNDQQVIYYVCEKISCEMAWLKTSGRKLCFRVLNAETGGTLALLTRPCKPCFCLSNIFVCCSTQSLDALLPDGRYFGSVRKVFHFSHPKYIVFDSEGAKMFEVTAQNFGNICPCWLVTNNTLKVKRSGADDGDEESGQPIFIQKNYTNMCIENTYTLSVEPMMTNKNKVLLLALIILIDFQHFKRFGTTCHFCVWFFWLALIFFAFATLFVYVVICSAKELPCDDFEAPDIAFW